MVSINTVPINTRGQAAYTWCTRPSQYTANKPIWFTELTSQQDTCLHCYKSSLYSTRRRWIMRRARLRKYTWLNYQSWTCLIPMCSQSKHYIWRSSISTYIFSLFTSLQRWSCVLTRWLRDFTKKCTWARNLRTNSFWRNSSKGISSWSLSKGLARSRLWGP